MATGKIRELIYGRDGYARGAKVRVAESGKRPTLLDRLLQRLFPLELDEPSSSEQHSEEIDEEIDLQVDKDVERQTIAWSTAGKPLRNAAITGNLHRQVGQGLFD